MTTDKPCITVDTNSAYITSIGVVHRLNRLFWFSGCVKPLESVIQAYLSTSANLLYLKFRSLFLPAAQYKQSVGDHGCLIRNSGVRCLALKVSLYVSLTVSSSLTLEEIPIKLRCASCNKLAQEAVKLPCCDQNICSDCKIVLLFTFQILCSLPFPGHANKLETTCPICYHEPVNAHDCRPNKALRQTVKIFLKRKVIDRENARKQEMLQKAGAANASDAVTSQEDQKPAASQAIKQETPVANGIEDVVKDTEDQPPSNESQATQFSDPSGLGQETQRDIPQQSIEVNPFSLCTFRPQRISYDLLTPLQSPGPQDTPRRASTTTVENGNNALEKPNDNEGISDAQQISKTGQSGKQENKQGVHAAGFDASAGGYPNMGFNGVGDMTQMMQMMPNGMPNPMMAGFPNMMGMFFVGLLHMGLLLNSRCRDA